MMLAEHWELLHIFSFAKKILCTQSEEKPELQLSPGRWFKIAHCGASLCSALISVAHLMTYRDG